MPKVDLTITVSVIVALAAIISPILTTIINNRYQLKQKRMELKQKKYEQTVLYKRTIFENYLRYLNEVAQHPTDDSISGYAQHYPLAYLYLPDEVRNKISIVNHKLSKTVIHANIIDDIDEIIIGVSKEIEKL